MCESLEEFKNKFLNTVIDLYDYITVVNAYQKPSCEDCKKERKYIKELWDNFDDFESMNDYIRELSLLIAELRKHKIFADCQVRENGSRYFDLFDELIGLYMENA